MSSSFSGYYCNQILRYVNKTSRDWSFLMLRSHEHIQTTKNATLIFIYRSVYLLYTTKLTVAYIFDSIELAAIETKIFGRFNIYSCLCFANVCLYTLQGVLSAPLTKELVKNLLRVKLNRKGLLELREKRICSVMACFNHLLGYPQLPAVERGTWRPTSLSRSISSYTTGR